VKVSYKTSDVAQSAALEIKKAYPIDQVSIYDSVDNSARLLSYRAPPRKPVAKESQLSRVAQQRKLWSKANDVRLRRISRTIHAET
jgi:hypothetical protein